MELWCRLIAAQCSSSCNSEELEGEKDFNAALRNQCAVWLALQSRQQKNNQKNKLKLQAAFRVLSLLRSAVARLCLPLMLLPHHKHPNKLSAAGLYEFALLENNLLRSCLYFCRWRCRPSWVHFLFWNVLTAWKKLIL